MPRNRNEREATESFTKTWEDRSARKKKSTTPTKNMNKESISTKKGGLSGGLGAR